MLVESLNASPCCVGALLLYFWTHESSSLMLYNRKFGAVLQRVQEPAGGAAVS